MQETQVRSLGREDPLAKEMATHFRILAWKIPWIEEPGRLQSVGLQRHCTVDGSLNVNSEGKVEPREGTGQTY